MKIQEGINKNITINLSIIDFISRKVAKHYYGGDIEKVLNISIKSIMKTLEYVDFKDNYEKLYIDKVNRYQEIKSKNKHK